MEIEKRYIADSKKEVKDALFYVTCTDSFLSGWGKAKNKKCKYIYPCDSYEEAERIANNFRYRNLKYINICCRKPFYTNSVNIVDVDKDSWFRTH